MLVGCSGGKRSDINKHPVTVTVSESAVYRGTNERLKKRSEKPFPFSKAFQNFYKLFFSGGNTDSG